MQKVFPSQLNPEEFADHLEGGILCLKNDAVFTVAYANDYFYRMLGFRPGELNSLLGDGHGGVLRDDQLAEWETLINDLHQLEFTEPELKLYRKDGHHIWSSARLRLMKADRQEYICALLLDVTEERRDRRAEKEQLEAIRQAEKELADSEQRYRIIMEQAADPIFDYNLKSRKVYCSPSFRERFNFEIEGGQYLNKLEHSDFVFEEDRDRALTDAKTGLWEGLETQIGEYRLKVSTGRYCWHRVRSTIIRNEAGEAVRIIIFFADIDKQKKETLRLREQAERDLLTGLYNHVTTTDRINKAIEEGDSGVRHALFVIDIDNFKNVNDQLGHLYGDEVLSDISTKLKEQFRDEDIIGRIGGDEFVVFLRNIPSEKLIRLKSRILNELFRGTQTNGTISCSFSCSVGVALCPKDGTDYHELFRKADIAMYAAKRGGKNICCIYSPDLEQSPLSE